MRRLLGHPVTQVAAALLVAFLLVTSLTAWLGSRAAEREAIADARSVNRVLGLAVIQPAIPRGLAAQEAGTAAALGDRVRGHLDVEGVRRVKLWRGDGTIVYSDEPRLVGRRFDLGDDERAVLEHGGTDAEVSDLEEPENVYERGFGDTVEVYSRVRSPEGDPLLFESYISLADVNQRQSELNASFRPVTVVGTAVLTLLIAPLAWWLSRRLRRDAESRERLLRTAVEASDAERRRIARDLHDGVVQDLAGAAFTLAGAARTEPVRPGLVEDVGDSVRHSLRSLRSLLVEIYPPDLAEVGLQGALDDLLAPVEAAGIATVLEVDEVPDLSPTSAALVWRVAQETIRNAVHHGRPDRLVVRVRASGTRSVRLVVEDDGTGFDQSQPPEPGHIGLRGLRDATKEAGGRLDIDTVVGRGTRVELEVTR
jgi:two-component system NarL family sensor kinase